MIRTLKLLTASITGYCVLTAGTAGAGADNNNNNNIQPLSAPAAASVSEVHTNAVKVTSHVIKEETPLVKVDLNIPVISGLKDAKYQKQLNDSISHQALKDLAAIKQQAVKDADSLKKAGIETHGFPYEIVIKYDLAAEGGAKDQNRFSLKVLTYTFTGGAHGITRTDTYNVTNTQPAVLITLQDLFGPNYKSIINAFIKADIAKHPEDFFQGDEGFKGISDDQLFYIHNGYAIIVFPPYEIAPYSSGSPEFPIPIPGAKPTAELRSPSQL